MKTRKERANKGHEEEPEKKNIFFPCVAQAAGEKESVFGFLRILHVLHFFMVKNFLFSLNIERLLRG